jgi:hypothetical protein
VVGGQALVEEADVRVEIAEIAKASGLADAVVEFPPNVRGTQKAAKCHVGTTETRVRRAGVDVGIALASLVADLLVARDRPMVVIQCSVEPPEFGENDSEVDQRVGLSTHVTCAIEDVILVSVLALALARLVPPVVRLPFLAVRRGLSRVYCGSSRAREPHAGVRVASTSVAVGGRERSGRLSARAARLRAALDP